MPKHTKSNHETITTSKIQICCLVWSLLHFEHNIHILNYTNLKQFIVKYLN